MKIFTSCVKSALVLAGAFLFSVNAQAQDAEPQVIDSEDFEQVTLVDQNGEALTSSWSYGYGLSNGWKIVGGTIFSSDGSTNYGLIKSSGKGYDESDCYLEASYSTSSNAASVYIPKKYTGEVSFYVKAAKTSKDGYVTVFEADAEGNVSTTPVMPKTTITKGSGWTQYTFDVVDKYIAINLICAQLDNFVVTAKEDVQPEEHKSLEIKAFSRDSEEYEFVVKPNETIVVPFKVTIQNTGNVDLTADEATFSLKENGEVVFSMGVALKAGEEKEVGISMNYTEAEAGEHVYNVVESVTNTEYQYSARCTIITEADWIATGINAAKTAQQKAEIYTLNGQRVAEAVKGLYIVNGKKVVVK